MSVENIVLQEEFEKPRAIEMNLEDGDSFRYEQIDNLSWDFKGKRYSAYGCVREWHEISYDDTCKGKINLKDKGRWTILEARETGELETISSVTAIVYVDFDRIFVGQERALMDFLNTYKDQIGTYDPMDI